MSRFPRRRFLAGVVGGGVTLGLSPALRALAQAPPSAATGTPPVLAGTEFDLTIGETLVNFTGAPAVAATVNGSLPAPILRWREGDTVTVRVTNRMREMTSLHWHGILLPAEMDGVPGISFHGIPPGETFVYRFPVRQSGTYWYHSHSGFQEQTGMYGAIVIDPVRADAIRADRDYVVQLSDWTDESPARLLAKLKVQSDYYNFNRLTAQNFF
ncbi:MAG TPA: multicopper oxidase domain-containing protein, partial [Gammaproteobacteria bacterium]